MSVLFLVNISCIIYPVCIFLRPQLSFNEISLNFLLGSWMHHLRFVLNRIIVSKLFSIPICFWVVEVTVHMFDFTPFQ